MYVLLRWYDTVERHLSQLISGEIQEQRLIDAPSFELKQILHINCPQDMKYLMLLPKFCRKLIVHFAVLTGV